MLQLKATFSKVISLQDMFDKDVGPFQQKYVHLVEDIHSVYGTAKEVHGPSPLPASAERSLDNGLACLDVYQCDAVSCKGHTNADRRIQLPCCLQAMGRHLQCHSLQAQIKRSICHLCIVTLVSLLHLISSSVCRLMCHPMLLCDHTQP